MPTTLRRRALVAAVAALSIVALAPGARVDARATGAGPAPRVGCTESPFTSQFAAYLAQRWPANRISASVYDSRTNCEYQYRPDLRMTTASVIKIEIMAGILLRAQREGRGLDAWETDRLWPMITQSADTPASELWWSLGGLSAMQQLDREFGLTQTVAAGPTWGLTTTSASDRNRLLRQVLLGQYGPLNATSRAIARSYMLKVTPSQRWGATSGAPADWPVPLKNGFFDSRCCRWRLNTSGVVERPDGSAYVLTVLTDGWPSDRPGIEAASFVSNVIARATAAPLGPFASPTRFAHQQYVDVLARAPSFAESVFTTEYTGYSAARAPAIVTGLLGSDEFDRGGGTVLRLYLGGLGRPTTGASFDYRTRQLRRGEITAAGLARSITRSAELNGATPPTDAEFVDRVALGTLGRLQPAKTRQGWLDLLADGGDRGRVLLSLASSATGRRHLASRATVAATFLTMLDRAPSPADLAAWSARLDHGTEAGTLVAMVLRSREYRDRVS